MKDIGQHLRAVRVQRGWTLETLAEHSGLSSGFLSQVERGLSTLSIVSLSAICHALDIPVQQVFSSSGPLDRAPKVRKASEQLHLRIGASPVAYRYLTGQLPSAPIQELLIAEFPRGMPQQESSHEGQELGYVLEGSLVLRIRDETHHLSAGDSYHIDASEPHTYLPSGDTGAKVLMAVTQRFIDLPAPPAADTPNGRAAPSNYPKEPDST